MNSYHSGRVTGPALLLILIIALVVAWLAVTQLGALRKPQPESAAQPAADLVQQAQDAVNALNEQMEQRIAQP